MTTPAPRNAAVPPCLRRLLGVAALAGIIFAVHGQALQLGWFMDDYAHMRQLRNCGWSLAELADACRLELVGGTIELWWLPDVTLRFFRPLAFGLMKASYTLLDWNAGAMHAVSLLWHLAVCVLLFVLLRCCGASSWLAWGVAVLFAIHPGHVATVQWIACQSELMVTTFLLGATLCFGRFRGWPGFAPVGREAAHGGVWGIGAIVLFVLALGCRENAIMFPLVMATVEPIVWRRRDRRVLLVYGMLGALIIAYLLLRTQVLGGSAVPPRPYVVPPADPDFFRYVIDKALYYLLGEFLLYPCVPIGGLPYFHEHPWLFYVPGVAVVLVLLAVSACFWRRRPGLLGPAWLLGFVAPVLPVFASPHHLYLPGVGWAVVLMLLLRWLAAGPAQWSLFWRRVRRFATAGVTALAMLFFAWISTWVALPLRNAHQVEDCLVAEMIAAPSGLEDGDTLYVANLPMIGHYARLAIEQRTGLRNLRVVPLTWAPRILGMATPAELRWIDEHTIEMHVAGDRYFAGPMARLIEEATGGPIPDRVDAPPPYGFVVTVLERDAAGISSLRFEFDRPLGADDIHLFWGSRARWAYEVRPDDHR